MEPNLNAVPLSDFPGLLKVVYSGQRTGILELTTSMGMVALHVRMGSIVNVEVPRGVDWVLGDYLVQGELVTHGQLLRALRLAARRSIAPEQVLVERGWISTDVLKRYVDVATRETLFHLFHDPSIQSRFLPQEPMENPYLPSLPIPFLLKEGERQSSDWTAISSRIPNLRTVFDKNPDFVRDVLANGQAAEAILFSERGEGGLSAQEKLIYYHLDGKRNVRQLGRLAGLDTYGTCRALVQLESRGIATLKAIDRPEVPIGPSLFHYLVQGAAYLLLGGVLTWILLVQPGTLQVASGRLPVDLSFVSSMREQGQQHQIRRAMQSLLLRKLTCPESLGEAAKTGLLDADALGAYQVICDPDNGFAILPRSSEVPE